MTTITVICPRCARSLPTRQPCNVATVDEWHRECNSHLDVPLRSMYRASCYGMALAMERRTARRGGKDGWLAQTVRGQGLFCAGAFGGG